jgi:hypothetical protein
MLNIKKLSDYKKEVYQKSKDDYYLKSFDKKIILNLLNSSIFMIFKMSLFYNKIVIVKNILKFHRALKYMKNENFRKTI